MNCPGESCVTWLSSDTGRLISQVHCYEPEWRRMRTWSKKRVKTCSAENIQAIAILWVQFAKGLGIARDDILNYEPLPVIRAALEMYYRLYSKVIGQLPSARGSYSKGPAQADERGTRSVREIRREIEGRLE